MEKIRKAQVKSGLFSYRINSTPKEVPFNPPPILAHQRQIICIRQTRPRDWVLDGQGGYRVGVQCFACGWF